MRWRSRLRLVGCVASSPSRMVFSSSPCLNSFSELQSCKTTMTSASRSLRSWYMATRNRTHRCHRDNQRLRCSQATEWLASPSTRLPIATACSCMRRIARGRSRAKGIHVVDGARFLVQSPARSQLPCLASINASRTQSSHSTEVWETIWRRRIVPRALVGGLKACSRLIDAFSCLNVRDTANLDNDCPSGSTASCRSGVQISAVPIRRRKPGAVPSSEVRPLSVHRASIREFFRKLPATDSRKRQSSHSKRFAAARETVAASHRSSERQRRWTRKT